MKAQLVQLFVIGLFDSNAGFLVLVIEEIFFPFLQENFSLLLYFFFFFTCYKMLPRIYIWHEMLVPAAMENIDARIRFCKRLIFELV